MEPLVLYSTNTRLAFRINQRFYGQLHYVWCNPYFSSDSAPKLEVDMPPSSTPLDLYRAYQSDIERQDRHSSNLSRNATGILKGINSKKEAGVISESKYQELLNMIKEAPLEEFRPLLYVIPFQGVASLVKAVSPLDQAALFAQEFLIEQLPRSLFDVLWW